MIKLSHVSKNYGSLEAVKNLSLEVPPGSIFAFLGLNGAGKTTTIRMMTGILQPTRGSIYIGGYDLHSHTNEAKSIVGYVPDRPHLYPKLTGREFLYFMSQLYHTDPRTTDRRIDMVLEEYSMTPWQDSLIEGYSHGMKQRIAMCGALVHNPRILIVDEPMVGLDPRGAHELKQAFKRYAKAGITIFLSTHTLSVAEELADNIAIIHQGSILTKGTLDDIREITSEHSAGLEQMFLQLTTSHIDH